MALPLFFSLTPCSCCRAYFGGKEDRSPKLAAPLFVCSSNVCRCRPPVLCNPHRAGLLRAYASLRAGKRPSNSNTVQPYTGTINNSAWSRGFFAFVLHPVLFRMVHI